MVEGRLALSSVIVDLYRAAQADPSTRFWSGDAFFSAYVGLDTASFLCFYDRAAFHIYSSLL